MNNYKEQIIREKTLHIEKYCLVEDIEPEYFKQHTEEIKELNKTRLVTQFKYLTDRSIEKIVKYPKTWFEVFKKQYFPKWLIKKFPVNYQIIEIKITECFPTTQYDVGKPYYTIAYMDYYE